MKFFGDAERVLLDLGGMAEGVGLILFAQLGRHVDIGHAMGAAAVSDTDVEIAVGSESQAAAVVLAVDPVQFEQHALAGRIGAVGIAGRDPEFGGPPGVGGLALERRVGPRFGAVVDEEPPVGGEIGMKGQGQQAALVEGRQQVHQLGPKIDERRGQRLAVGAENVDDARLIAEKTPLAAVRRRDQQQWRLEAPGHQFECDLGQSLRPGRRRSRAQPQDR